METENTPLRPTSVPKRVALPLVPSTTPGSLEIDNQKIAKILEDDELASIMHLSARQLDLFHGDANPAVARAYLRIRPPFPLNLNSNDLTISGRLHGPFCEFAETLPLRLEFLQLESESGTNTLLAEATVPDPNFWTPELPFVYRARIEVRRREELLLKEDRLLGIRRFGVRERFFRFEGKRFVLRGVHAMGNGEWGMGNEVAFLRESWTAVLTENPNDDLCEFASRNGIMLVADLANSASNGESLLAELHRLSQWPAVFIAVLPQDAIITKADRLAAPNLLIANRVRSAEPIRTCDWADLEFVEVGDSHDFAERVQGLDTPVVAVRRSPSAESIEQARAGCDELQYDLARFDDYAGYIA